MYILIYWKNTIFIIIKVYINNLALVFKSKNSLNKLKKQLDQELNIKDRGKAQTIIR